MWCGAPRQSNDQVLHINIRDNWRRELPEHNGNQEAGLLGSPADESLPADPPPSWSSPPPSSLSSLGQCLAVREYHGTQPTGWTNETLTLLFNITTANTKEDCPIACCDVGAELCQYAWVFGNMCIAVSCSKDVMDNCVPSRVKLSTLSIYTQMTFTPAVVPPHLDPTLSPTPLSLPPSLPLTLPSSLPPSLSPTLPPTDAPNSGWYFCDYFTP